MLVLGVVVAVPMPMSSTVGVHVFVLVEDDLKMASERLGNTAERFQAGDMVASLQARDHRFGHSQPRDQLFLRLAGGRRLIKEGI